MDSKPILEIIHAKSASIAKVAVRSTMPDLEAFKERKNTIAAVGGFINNVQTALDALKREFNNLKALQEEETAAIKSLIDETTPEDSSWVTVAKKQRKPAAVSARRSTVTITQGLDIEAVTVQSFDQVKQDGDIYYVAPRNHFAIRIGGMLFHGNIGTIYTDEQVLAHTTDCKYVKGCTRAACEFYHDPTLFPESSDVRNYHNSSFCYSPAKDHKYGFHKHFGSYPHLNNDLTEVTPHSAVLLRDQAFHDLLCAIIATKYTN